MSYGCVGSGILSAGSSCCLYYTPQVAVHVGRRDEVPGAGDREERDGVQGGRGEGRGVEEYSVEERGVCVWRERGRSVSLEGGRSVSVEGGEESRKCVWTEGKGLERGDERGGRGSVCAVRREGRGKSVSVEGGGA